MSGLLVDNSSASLFSIKEVCVFWVVNEIKSKFVLVIQSSTSYKVIRIRKSMQNLKRRYCGQLESPTQDSTYDQAVVSTLLSSCVFW